MRFDSYGNIFAEGKYVAVTTDDREWEVSIEVGPGCPKTIGVFFHRTSGLFEICFPFFQFCLATPFYED